MSDEIVEVQTLGCTWSKCKRREQDTVKVNRQEYMAFQMGTKRIQDAMPTTPAPIREQMMTGTHPECWEEMWNEMED